MVCQLAYIPEETLVHVVGLAPTKDNQVRLISKEGAFAAQPRMRKFRIADFEFELALC